MEQYIFQVLGIVVTMVLGAWGIIKYVLDHTDKKRSEERKERLEVEAELRSDIDRLKDTHVSKEDFYRHADSVKAELNNLSVSLMSRLDALTNLVTQILLTRPTPKE